MYENLIEIWWTNVRFWMCSSHRTIMYKGILVVGAYHDKIEKLMKKWCQKGPKIDAKINILAIRGPTFEVLGHVFWKMIFLWFLRHPKIDQKSKKGGPKSKRGGQGCPKSKVSADLGSALRNVRGRRGGDYEGGASNMMRFDEWILAFWNLIWHAEHPGCARGGGSATRAFRRAY